MQILKLNIWKVLQFFHRGHCKINVNSFQVSLCFNNIICNMIDYKYKYVSKRETNTRNI